MTVDLGDEEVEATVFYTISGRYVRPGRHDPGDEPEIEVHKILRNDTDEELTEDQVWPTQFMRQAWEQDVLEQHDADAYASACDRAYDEWKDRGL